MNGEGGKRRELKMVAWGFGALVLALCLLGYSPTDPCPWLRAGLTHPVANWMGPLGAALAGWLMALLGYAAWLLPPAIAVPPLRALGALGGPARRETWPRRFWRRTGFGLLLLAASVLLGLVVGRVELEGMEVHAGGIAGAALALALAELVGKPGAVLLTLVATLVALMAAVDFSPVRAWDGVVDLVGLARDQLEAVWARRRESLGSGAARLEPRLFEKTRVIPRVPEKTQVQISPRDPVAPSPELPAPPAPPAKDPTIKPPANVPVIKPSVAKGPVIKPSVQSTSGKKPKQEKFPFIKEGEFELPPIDLLDEVSQARKEVDREGLLANARILEDKFKDFAVKGEVVEVQPGPVVTMYEYKPGPGIKINKISNLADDLAMALSAISVRIVAPIPGKNVVGIEISNRERETVYFREIVEESEFQKSKSPLAIALGKDTVGHPYSFDLRKAPHLLVAGSTGSGKSVGLNSMIMSVLLRSTPADVRMLMIDPKRLELSVYEGVPHLLHPVIADPKEAALALKWAVAEMERRYQLLAAQGVRHIDSYNRLVEKGGKEDPPKSAKSAKAKKAAPAAPAGEENHGGETVAKELGGESGAEIKPVEPPTEKMPVILIIIDELADLMMVAARDCEESICRLAQMARASGIHMILATQRPSVDVITGLIKANFPSRISFKVASKIDSRTILDQNGSERLLGQGDMLFLGPGTSNLVRLHGAFVSDAEIKAVTGFIREQAKPDYNAEIVAPRGDDQEFEDEPLDEKWEAALQVAVQTGLVSVSMLQRKLKIGYNRAARIIEMMEARGLVGPSDGVKPREVLLDQIHLDQMEQSLA